MELDNAKSSLNDQPVSPSVLPDHKPRRRVGKIAQMSVELRDFVNNSLDNGTPYAEIATQLAAKGIPGINDDNVSNWANGGYQDYLREKRRDTVLREQTDKLLTLAASLDDQGRVGLEKVSGTIVAAKIIDALQNFDSRLLHSKMADDPALFFRAARIVNAQSLDLTRLRKVELEFQKYKDHVAEQKRKVEAAMKPAKKAEGLTKEQIAEIHEAMRLL